MVRTWTARINGTIRVYLDGAREPIYDGPATPFFTQTWYPFLEDVGLDPSLFDRSFAQRDAGYFPIPFAERLRVEWTGDLEKLHFYEIQVLEYEPGTVVETFTPEDLRTYRGVIEEAAPILTDLTTAFAYPAEHEGRALSVTVPPGEKREMVRLDGPKAISRLTLKLEAGDLGRALRQTLLYISFDGDAWPQVQSPLGDFFGAAPGINPYESLPFTVDPDGRMTSRFVMPFADSVRVVVENRSDEPVTISGSVLAGEYSWDEERSMHFRARWRVDHDLSPTMPFDMPFLLADGKGLYVGTTSLLQNPSEVPASGGNWWGEGDEKIFVDEDALPSIFGTGSEDYYNYSWSSPDIFDFAYAGQPRNDGPDNRGFVTNYRWHVLDPIPFHDRLRFYMELFRHEYEPGMTYARVSYHYARPGLMDDHVPISDEDIRPPALVPWEPAARGAARNATFYQTEELVGGHPESRLEEGVLWAGGQLFVWEPARRGDSLSIPVSVAEGGRYRFTLTVLQDSISGTFAPYLDGRRIMAGDTGAETLDLYRPHRRVLRNYHGEPLEVEAGRHTLSLSYEGAGEAGRNRLGLDFIWVRKVD